jgi:hypothetical protein
MTDGNNSKKALTRRELAAQIQVTCETLSRWHAQGRGPRCVKDGRCVRYHPDEVEAWLRGERDTGPDVRSVKGRRL